MDAYSTATRLERAENLATRSRSTVPAPLLAALATAFIAAAIQSLWIPIDADVSWLMTAAERVVSGDRLYVDVFEVNPPAAVWLYVPFVWLAKLIGAKPEAVVAAGFIAGGLASVMAAVRLAPRLDVAPRPPGLAAALGFTTLVLPMALFAEREHAALLLAVPALVATALVAEGKRLGRFESLASGAAAGLVIVIKPYFLLAVLAPALWAAWKRRSPMPMAQPVTAGVATVGLYGLAMLVFTAPYFEWLPEITHTYARMHNVWWKVIVGPTVFPAVCLMLAMLLRAPRIPPLAMAWGLGAAGFVLSAIAQAKNYPNHWLPGVGLAFAATFALMASPGIAKARRVGVAAGLGILAVFTMRQWTILPDPALTKAIEQVAPPGPKIISLSPQLTTGFPVTRNVGGHWVGSSPGLFGAAGARFVGLKDETSRTVYRKDIQSFIADVEHKSPDVVLVDRPSKSWLMPEPAIAQVMRSYRPAATAGDTEIWVRR